jgi:hAT family C-terminal dimerisation region
MASSVSSERAFSSAGITISKRHNQLKGDIVEALQCMKVVYHSDLIFREVIVTKELEKELEDLEPYVPGHDEDWEDVDVYDAFSWDQLVADDDAGHIVGNSSDYDSPDVENHLS